MTGVSYSHAESLRGHVAIVTGAAQGVGKGIATALLERGAKVLLVDIQEEVLDKTHAELKAIGPAEPLVANLRDPQSAQRITAAAKEGIRGLSKVAALEWGRDNIRVNVICPFAESDGVKYWKSFAPKEYEKAVGRVPMKRIGDVRTDVGALVAFLLGSDATFITGQTIHVDGGIGCFR